MEPNQIEVATSFTKNINLQAYGGRPFESESVFVSVKTTCDPNQKDAVIRKLSQEIQWTAEEILKERITKLKS